MDRTALCSLFSLATILCSPASSQSRVVTLDPAVHIGGSPSVGIPETLEAGRYVVEHISGCYNDGPGWGIAAVSVNSGSNHWEFPWNYYSSHSVCSATNRGSTLSFDHQGGTAWFWVRDAATSNNTYNGDIVLVVYPESAVFRNGSGINPPEFHCVTVPRIGVDWTTTYGQSSATLGTLLAVAMSGPDPGTPLGNFELLISPVAAPLLLASSGDITVPIPNNQSFAGVSIFTQGARIDSGPAGSRLVLLNALDVTL